MSASVTFNAGTGRAKKHCLTLLLALAYAGSKLPFLTVLYPLPGGSLHTLYL
ncbi:hypothetical protein [Proteus terrae]|uniref:hypothetical protein n=1 Tax=Proteus terrae TaxID=1574161 RepID=UPI002889C04B|nr:hypothetical protein [Proteus terrae]